MGRWGLAGIVSVVVAAQAACPAALANSTTQLRFAGAEGMAMDGSSVVVLDFDRTAISKVDTATLTERSRFFVAPLSLRTNIALAGLVPTTTTLAASASTITYGKSVTLNAHVNGATSGTIVLYETPYGGSKTLVTSVEVNGSGNASFLVKPTGKTTYTAEFQESATHESSSSPGRTIAVRSRATATLSGFYRRSGKYRLYRPGQSVDVRGTVVPNHAGHGLKFVARRYRNGKWRRAATGTFPIQYDGSAYAVLSNATRGKYRQRVVFAGDADHLGSTSRWVYLKITR
jgi:hypothetical protein